MVRQTVKSLRKKKKYAVLAELGSVLKATLGETSVRLDGVHTVNTILNRTELLNFTFLCAAVTGLVISLIWTFSNIRKPFY